MSTAKRIDKENVVKQRDGINLLKAACTRFKSRELLGCWPSTIVEIGSNTGKTTAEIARAFPCARVIGVEADSNLTDYARDNYKPANLRYITASISQDNFLAAVQSMGDASLGPASVDLIFSFHLLRSADGGHFEVAMRNIASLLKPDGQLCATISLWSELFEIEKRIALKCFPDLLTRSQRASNLVMLTKPNRAEEKTQLKALLTQIGFADSPEFVDVSAHIKLKSLKTVQNAIMWMCPIGSCMEESSRLRFYSLFFDEVYNDYFGQRSSVHGFEYEYLLVVACKLG
ncbi:hypothetical protein TYRP_004200 [Tyrophagus putrescentiae]|nr:hypothetical protein TYRP_004200 [Tyrophagus putrescentiae]